MGKHNSNKHKLTTSRSTSLLFAKRPLGDVAVAVAVAAAAAVLLV